MRPFQFAKMQKIRDFKVDFFLISGVNAPRLPNGDGLQVPRNPTPRRFATPAPHSGPSVLSSALPGNTADLWMHCLILWSGAATGCHEFPPIRSVLNASLRNRKSKIHRSQIDLHGSEPGLPWTTNPPSPLLSGGPAVQSWRAWWWSCQGSARQRCPKKDIFHLISFHFFHLSFI